MANQNTKQKQVKAQEAYQQALNSRVKAEKHLREMKEIGATKWVLADAEKDLKEAQQEVDRCKP